MLTSGERFMKTEFSPNYFHCRKRMLVKSVSVANLHAHLYAKIVSNDEKSKKFITSPKNVLYFVQLQKLPFVENLEAHG